MWLGAAVALTAMHVALSKLPVGAHAPRAHAAPETNTVQILPDSYDGDLHKSHRKWQKRTRIRRARSEAKATA